MKGLVPISSVYPPSSVSRNTNRHSVKHLLRKTVGVCQKQGDTFPGGIPSHITVNDKPQHRRTPLCPYTLHVLCLHLVMDLNKFLCRVDSPLLPQGLISGLLGSG